jgi:hypothetical protein
MGVPALLVKRHKAVFSLQIQQLESFEAWPGLAVSPLQRKR